MTLQRSAMKRSRPKPGSGIPDDVRAAVLLRDEGKCQRCGMWLANVPSSIHHRKPRKAGGRHGAAADQINDMANLVTLCGTGTTGCHGEIEHDRNQARDDGWLVYEHEDPADVMVLSEWGYRYYGQTWRDA